MRSTSPRAVLVALGAASLVVAAVAACSSSSAGGGVSCPTLSTDCPSVPPDWTTDVQPLIATYCFQCHGEGGIEQSQFDYTTYAGVYKNRAEMLTQVYECAMPPYDASPPTAAFPSAQDRQTLVAWLACGAPGPSAAGSDGGAPDASKD